MDNILIAIEVLGNTKPASVKFSSYFRIQSFFSRFETFKRILDIAKFMYVANDCKAQTEELCVIRVSIE